jgi:hypothetical protein
MAGPVTFEDAASSAPSSAPPGAVSFEDAKDTAPSSGTVKSDLMIKRDAPGERSGDVANIAAGGNEAIAQTLGMPMDLSNWLARG